MPLPALLARAGQSYHVHATNAVFVTFAQLWVLCSARMPSTRSATGHAAGTAATRPALGIKQQDQNQASIAYSPHPENAGEAAGSTQSASCQRADSSNRRKYASRRRTSKQQVPGAGDTGSQLNQRTQPVAVGAAAATAAAPQSDVRRTAAGASSQGPVAPSVVVDCPAKRRRRSHAAPTCTAAHTAAANNGAVASASTGQRLIQSPAAAAGPAPVGLPGCVHAASGSSGGSAGASSATAGPLLLDLGQLVVGEVLQRPSATVKTPYVADVQLSDGSEVLAHTPSLDGAGTILPGRHVYMTAHAAKADGKQSTVKTTHSVQVAEDVRLDGTNALVGIHPNLAEKLAESAMQQYLLPLPPALQRYTNVQQQQKAGTGRVDFALCYPDGSRLLLEVKNAVCADYPQGLLPSRPKKIKMYISAAQPYTRTALFPHGKLNKQSGVVSDRAIKHLHELTQLHQTGQDSEGRPVKCAVLFIVNRSDCAAFRPCEEADMVFARMVLRAQQAGVLVLAHDIVWQDGKAYWGRSLPVVYGPEVRAADVDEAHLEAVLHFNATNPRTRWKKAKKQKGGAD